SKVTCGRAPTHEPNRKLRQTRIRSPGLATTAAARRTRAAHLRPRIAAGMAAVAGGTDPADQRIWPRTGRPASARIPCRTDRDLLFRRRPYSRDPLRSAGTMTHSG